MIPNNYYRTIWSTTNSTVSGYFLSRWIKIYIQSEYLIHIYYFPIDVLFFIFHHSIEFCITSHTPHSFNVPNFACRSSYIVVAVALQVWPSLADFNAFRLQATRRSWTAPRNMRFLHLYPNLIFVLIRVSLQLALNASKVLYRNTLYYVMRL